MKKLLINLGLSLIVTSIFNIRISASETLQEGNQPCVTAVCIVEALKTHTGSEIIISGSDYGPQGHNVYMASTEGVIVSGPDYGPENPRKTYAA